MKRIAHRGASGYEPENTLLAAAKALEIGVQGIEIDVWQCKSGEIVVIHDETLDRTTNGKGFVRDHTLAELKKLDAGKGEKIPTLQEYIEFLDKRAPLMIEMKDSASAKAVAHIIGDYVKKGWKYEDFWAISFIHPCLLDVYAVDPKVITGAVIAAIPIRYAEFAEHAKAKLICPALEFTDEAFVADAHKRGLPLIAWTVNDPLEIERARKLGIDGIMSDFPDRI